MLSGPFNLGPENVSIRVRPFSYTLATLEQDSTDREVRRAIKERWEAAYRADTRLFPGLKFRLTSRPETNNSASGLALRLDLHITDYGIFVATNSAARRDSKFAEYLQEQGQLFAGDKLAYFGNPLGNGSVVETSDKRIILTKRSDAVHEYPGCYDTPGGHAEPCLHGYDSEGQFDAICNELTEETNINAHVIIETRLIGVGSSTENFGKPEMLFMQKVDVLSSSLLPGEEVAAIETFSKDELFDRLRTGRVRVIPPSQALFVAYFSVHKGYDAKELFL